MSHVTTTKMVGHFKSLSYRPDSPILQLKSQHCNNCKLVNYAADMPLFRNLQVKSNFHVPFWMGRYGSGLFSDFSLEFFINLLATSLSNQSHLLMNKWCGPIILPQSPGQLHCYKYVSSHDMWGSQEKKFPFCSSKGQRHSQKRL